MFSQKLLLALLALNLSPIRSFTAPTRRRKPSVSLLMVLSELTTASAIATTAKTAKQAQTTTLVEATTTKTVKRRRKSTKWDRMVEQLQRYHNQQGHSLVSIEENAELAIWCKTIRRNYSHQLQVPVSDNSLSETTTTTRRPTLSDGKLDLLHELDFVWNVQSYLWDQRFEELCRFRATHHHCQVPRPKTEQTDAPLSMWVHNQKCHYRALLKGKPSSLTPARWEALAAIGFWDAFATHTTIWMTRLSELQEFYHAFGHSNVPEDYMEHYSLGQWVMNQRLHYKAYVAGLSSPLTPDRMAALEAVDFRWNLQSYNWFCMLERLREYAKEHGHVRIVATQDKKEDENCKADLNDLKLWLIQQRHSYQRKVQGRPSSMTDQRQEALEAISEFEWKAHASPNGGPSADDWQDLFQGLRQKGIAPGMRSKQHWFEGQNRWEEESNEIYDDDDLLDLWNQEGDEEGEEIEEIEEAREEEYSIGFS